MADSGGQPPGLAEPHAGSSATEMPSVSKYQPPPKRDDRITHNISESFGMLGGLSISRMKSILNPGSRPGDISFALGSSIPATNLALLVYLNLPKNTMCSLGAMGGSVQYVDMIQGSTLAHSTPFRTMQPKQGAKQAQEVLSEQTTMQPGVSPSTVTRQMEQLREEVPAAPPMKEKLRRSGKKPQVKLKSPRKVLDLASEVDSSDEEEDGRGQRVPRADSTEYIELFARIFELELNEYIKNKTAQGTAMSTATPAESVDYDALLHQRTPDIAEAMDILNVPRQVNESQQDYKRWQNAA
ncbi:hypothetical protein C0989_007873 [Termitomyces sp. Mn162]|nr:hypothetical protein C0989_007873 [Termitomyces sp. Mn162]